MAAIEIESLEKRFDHYEALSDINLAVAQGEFLTLLGPSGCGKTTLLKLISGFLSPTKGTIRINGRDVTRVPPEVRDTALCFQSYALFPHLTVRENIEFGPRQKRMRAGDRDLRVAEVSEALGLGPHMAKLPNQLSGGQQQRVSLGRALAMRPSIILFDEPLSNLDAKLRDQVRIEIRRIVRDFGLTAIYVTHDQAEALAMSDRVMVLNHGRVEQLAPPEMLYNRPRTRFVADFIGGANLLDGTIDREAAPGLWRINTKAGSFEARLDRPPTGRQVTVCWRPEHARIESDGIEARVVHRTFQGAFTDLGLEAGGVSFRVQLQETSAQEGETIRIAVRPERVQVLEEPA